MPLPHSFHYTVSRGHKMNIFQPKKKTQFLKIKALTHIAIWHPKIEKDLWTQHSHIITIWMMKIQNQNKSSLDLPQFLRHRVQQVHPWPQALQLAIPNLTHHDPHVLLFLPRLPSHQSSQGRGTPIHHDSWPLPQICGTHLSSVLPFPLVLLTPPTSTSLSPSSKCSRLLCRLRFTPSGFWYREWWKQRGSLEYKVQIYEFWIQGPNINFHKILPFDLVSLSFLCYFFLFWHLNKIWYPKSRTNTNTLIFFTETTFPSFDVAKLVFSPPPNTPNHEEHVDITIGLFLKKFEFWVFWFALCCVLGLKGVFVTVGLGVSYGDWRKHTTRGLSDTFQTTSKQSDFCPNHRWVMCNYPLKKKKTHKEK